MYAEIDVLVHAHYDVGGYSSDRLFDDLPAWLCARDALRARRRREDGLFARNGESVRDVRVAPAEKRARRNARLQRRREEQRGGPKAGRSGYKLTAEQKHWALTCELSGVQAARQLGVTTNAVIAMRRTARRNAGKVVAHG